MYNVYLIYFWMLGFCLIWLVGEIIFFFFKIKIINVYDGFNFVFLFINKFYLEKFFR